MKNDDIKRALGIGLGPWLGNCAYAEFHSEQVSRNYQFQSAM